MPFLNRQAIALTVFGLAVIGSGLIRYLSTTGGENGLYFGLVMGGLALLGALLAGLKFQLAGRIVGGLAIGVVIWWFTRDMYGDISATKVFGAAEVRKTIVMACGVGAAIVLLLPARKPLASQGLP